MSNDDNISTSLPNTAITNPARPKARIRPGKAVLGRLKQRLRLAALGAAGYEHVINPAAEIGFLEWERRRRERRKQRNREEGYRRARPKIIAARRRARRKGIDWALTKEDREIIRAEEALLQGENDYRRR